MAITIVTRAGKGSELEYAEVDANFTNLANALGAVLTPDVSDPTDDGQLKMVRVSDTEIRLKYKGMDGQVRGMILPMGVFTE